MIDADFSYSILAGLLELVYSGRHVMALDFGLFAIVLPLLVQLSQVVPGCRIAHGH